MSDNENSIDNTNLVNAIKTYKANTTEENKHIFIEELLKTKLYVGVDDETAKVLAENNGNIPDNTMVGFNAVEFQISQSENPLRYLGIFTDLEALGRWVFLGNKGKQLTKYLMSVGEIFHVVTLNFDGVVINPRTLDLPLHADTISILDYVLKDRNKPDDNTEIANAILEFMVPFYYDEENEWLDYATLFSCLGALAGFGCQMAVREGMVKCNGVPLNEALIEIVTTSGEKFYVGDFLNQPLFEIDISCLAMINGAISSSGYSNFPDALEIAGYVAGKIGDDVFWQGRVYDECELTERPIDSLQRHWNNAYSIIQGFKTPPVYIGFHFAYAAQMLIIESKEVFSPELAGCIFMEAAIAMAKVSPEYMGIYE